MKSLCISGFIVLLDDEDHDSLCNLRWVISDGRVPSPYIRRRINGKWEYLHRRLMGVTDTKMLVDHANANPLDNRRENLRVCSKSQNQMNHRIRADNKSGYKGVSFYKAYGRWISAIRANNKKIFLGYFDTAEEAGAAYAEAAKKYHGEFARLS